VCVATDVAARGLDMPALDLVIHADLPQNKEMLLHRSGRTGRAGRKGLSVMIVPAQHRGAGERLLASAKIKAVWTTAPSADAIRARDEENLVREIIAMADTPAEDDLAAGRVLLAERSAEQLAAVLVRIRREVLPAPEVLEDLEPLLRRADRMGTTPTQMEMVVQRATVNVAVTVATLKHGGQGLGYVLVFEDLSELLKAQKQAAWREVARRVAHEIKNPLTPIALSAERIRRHLQRATPPDAASLQVLHSCADTIAGAVETVRTLVDEFSTLARFPTARPQSADINSIVESTLAMFH